MLAGDLSPAIDFDVPSVLPPPPPPPRFDFAACLAFNFGNGSFDKGHKELPGDVAGWAVSCFLLHTQRLGAGAAVDCENVDEPPLSLLLLGAPPAVVDRSVNSWGTGDDAAELPSVDAPPISLTVKLDRLPIDAMCVAGSLVIVSSIGRWARAGGWRHKVSVCCSRSVVGSFPTLWFYHIKSKTSKTETNTFFALAVFCTRG